jgi:septal ring factor EnvC (AmiA/AmiB activator)
VEEEAGDALAKALRKAEQDGGVWTGGSCADLTRGGLSRPARGRVVAGFDPGRSGRRGVALATDQHAPVRAAARGQVVFTGVLRQLGRVVILRHGDRCHTVYACLSRVSVAWGAVVDANALLGAAGTCPQARGPGVYFELRFGEKALNPAEWFAASP